MLLSIACHKTLGSFQLQCIYIEEEEEGEKEEKEKWEEEGQKEEEEEEEGDRKRRRDRKRRKRLQDALPLFCVCSHIQCLYIQRDFQ